MANQALSGLFLLLLLAFVVLMIASTWMVYEKAGEPGWASIIPIYNTYVTLKIGGNPWWYLLLLLVPLVNVFIAVKMWVDVAEAFGLGLGWGLGLAFIPFIFLPLLAFGDYTYQGRGGMGGSSAAI